MIKKILVSFFLILNSLSVKAGAEVIERVIAIINNEPLLLSDLRKVQQNLDKPGFIDETLLPPYSLKDLKSNEKARLHYLINEKLVSFEIKRQNLTVTSERVSQEVQSMAKRANASVDELMRAIHAQGISTAEYKSFLKDKIEKQSLMQQEILSKIRISDEEILNEYQRSRPNKRGSVSQFRLAHIFFNPKKKSDLSAIERAKKAYERLKSGTDFGQIAEESSEDVNFEKDGFFGDFTSGDFDPTLEAQILSLKINEFSSPLESKSGIHIFKMLSNRVTIDPAFEREREKISSLLLERTFRSQLPMWLEEKRADAFIKLNLASNEK